MPGRSGQRYDRSDSDPPVQGLRSSIGVRVVLPVPGFVEVWFEAEPGSIFDQPVVNRHRRLQNPIFVFRADRVTANIKVQRSSAEMGAVHCKPCAARFWRLLPEMVLILPGPECRDNLEILIWGTSATSAIIERPS